MRGGEKGDKTRPKNVLKVHSDIGTVAVFSSQLYVCLDARHAEVG